MASANTLVAVVIFATLATLPACADLNAPLPSEVRVIVGGAGPGPFLLVTSNQFAGTVPSALTVAAADTVLVEPGFDQSFPLGARDRMYVSLSRPDGSTATPSVTLRVLLLGETICARESQALVQARLECLYLG